MRYEMHHAGEFCHSVLGKITLGSGWVMPFLQLGTSQESRIKKTCLEVHYPSYARTSRFLADVETGK